MRLVEHERELIDAYNMAYNEAMSAFGDGDIYVERFVECPRHVEIQVLADQTGHAIRRR